MASGKPEFRNYQQVTVASKSVSGKQQVVNQLFSIHPFIHFLIHKKSRKQTKSPHIHIYNYKQLVKMLLARLFTITSCISISTLSTVPSFHNFLLLFGCYCCFSSYSSIATVSANCIINNVQARANRILSGDNGITTTSSSIINNDNNKCNNRSHYPRYQNPIFSIRRGGSNVPKKLKKKVFGGNNDENNMKEQGKIKEESNIIHSLTSTNNNYSREAKEGEKGMDEEEVIYVTKRDGSRELFDSQKVSG